MSHKKEIEHKLEQQLDALSDKIDQLAAKMKEQERKASDMEHKAVLDLVAMRASAKEKLKSFKEHSGDDWRELQDGLTHYWTSLGTELKAYDGDL